MGEYAFKITIDPQLDNKLKDVENKFDAIANKSKETQKKVDEAFQSMATGGIDTFLTKLKTVETSLGNLKVGQNNSIASVGAAAQTSAAQVDKLLAVIAGMAKALSVKKSGGSKTLTDELKDLKTTGLESVQRAIDRTVASLSQAQSYVKLYNTQINDSGKSLSSYAFGQEGLKASIKLSEDLSKRLNVLQDVLNSLRKNDAFKNYISDLSGASSVVKQHKKDLEDLKNFIIEKNKLEQQSLANEKSRDEAFHKRATAKMNALFKEAEAEVKKNNELTKAEEKRYADFHKRATAKFNQIYKEQEAEEKKDAAIAKSEEKRYNDFHKRSTAKINQIYKEADAEVKAIEKRDATMIANSDKAMNHVLANIRKEEEARRKAIESNNPKGGSQFSALSAVTEWQGLNKQIKEASTRLATVKKIMADFSGQQGKETVLKYYSKELTLLESSIAKWRQRQQAIVDSTNAIAAQERFRSKMLSDAQGGLDFERQKSQARLDAMRQYYQEQERLAKIAYENRIKEAKSINLKKLSSYEGAMKFSDTAKTENRHRKAIEFLLEARKKLTTADAEYASKLEDLNGRIARHKLFLKATTTSTEELAKMRKKARMELENKFYSSNATNALSFSKSSKSINDQIRAIKYLTEARNKLNKDDKNYESTLAHLNNEIRRHKREIDVATEASNRLRGSHSNLMDTADQLKRSLALMFSVSAVTNYVNKLISVRGEFELQQRSLEAILQNKDEANMLWNKTVQLAVKSPFRVGELVSYTKQLAAYRIESDKLYETNKMLADISAGLGVDMGRLILAYGQVKAANYLRGTELRQFSEAGVNILGELSKYFTELEGTAVSVGDVFERVSKRMVSFEDVTHVLKNLTSESGIFYEMQEKQAETMKGMVSNLRDSIDLMLNEIGKSTEGSLKGALSFIKNLVDNWELMAAAIKAVVIALAIYKVNALLSADATAKFVYQSNHLTRQLKHQVTVTQLASAAWRKFKFSVKGASLSLKAFAASNVWLLGLTAIISTFYELSHANDELNERLKNINDTRDEEVVKLEKIVSLYKKLEKGNVKDGNYDEIKNIENKKSQLLPLQKLAKEKGIEVNLNLKEDAEENLNRQFNELKEKIDYSINFGTDFDASLAEELTAVEGWLHVFGDNLQTDMDEFSNSFSQLNGATRETVKKSMVEVGAMYDRLSTEAKGYYDTIKDGKKETETDDEYLLRQIEYLQKINSLYTRYEDAGYNGAKIRIYDLRHGKELYQIEKQRLNIVNKRTEFERELSKVADDILEKYGDISKLDDWQKKTIQLKIDKAFERMELNESAKRVAVFFLNQRFGLPVDLIIKPNEVALEQWQENVLNSITKLNRQLDGKYQIRFGIENVQGKTKEQVQNYIKGMLETAKKAVEIYEKLKGEQQIVSKDEYDKYKNRIPTLEKMAHIVGLLDTGAKKREQEQIKILNNRIKLIQDIHKEYKSLEKTMGETYAKERVLSSYANTFKQAFEGTGVKFKSSFIDEDKLNKIKEEGKKAGSIFSEEVLKEMDEIKEKGTYIRDFTEDLVETIKGREGFRSKAYKDTGGVYTLGYGDTLGVKKGDTTTKEAAEAKLRNRLTNEFSKQLNSVLDRYNDLIITQKQYNTLLDMTYQGGKKSVEKLLLYATDVEEGIKHIQEVYEDTKNKYGEKEAERFGESYLNSFKEAKNVYERIAVILKSINVYDKISIQKSIFGRAEKRSASWSGDLKVAEVLQQVVTNIAEIDFTNLQGVYDALKQLEPIAHKEGKKAEQTLREILSHVESQIEVEAKLENDKQIKNKIDGLFDDYEVYVALQGMDFPPDLANQLFDVGAISFDELKNKVVELKPDFQGKDMLNEWDKVMKKIDDMDAKRHEDRIKKYIKYIREEQDARVKLKIEEMKKLKEIEEDKDFTPQVKIDLKNNVKAEYKKQDQKQAWEDFKRTDIFTMMFNDLESLGTKALDTIYDNLQRLKASLTDLPVQDVKEIMDIINNIENVKAERNPFTEMRKAMSEVSRLKAEGRDEDFLQKEIANSQAKINMAQEELDVVNTIINARQQGIEITDEMMHGQERYTKLLNLEDSFLRSKKDALQQIIEANKDNMSNASKDLQAYVKARKSAKKLEEEWEQIFGITQKGYDSIKSILIAMGVDADSTALALADMGMSMVDLIAQAVMFGLQLKALSLAATVLGTELNAAFGPIGWAVLALQGIATIFTTVFGIKDKRKEKQIKKEQEAIEKLEKSYEKLEKAIDNAFSIDTIKNNSRLSEKNIQEQMNALRNMIDLENSKKKTDKDRIKDWENQIDELNDKLVELHENQIKSLGGFGSDDEFKNAAETFADAWYDAYQETGEGLSSLEDSFQDFMNNVVKKQLLFRGTEKILRPLLEMIDRAVADAVITKGEIDDINRVFDENTKEQLDKLYQSIVDELGIKPNSKGELSGLQEGIQGVTEETAQIIESYLNSIRFFVSDTNSKLSDFVDSIIGKNSDNPIVEQLKIVAANTSAIRSLLDSLTAPHPTLSGRGLKVII